MDYSELVIRTDHRLHDAGIARSAYAHRAGLRLTNVNAYCNDNAATVDNVARLIVAQHREGRAAGVDHLGTALRQMASDAGYLLVPMPLAGGSDVDAQVLRLARQLSDRMSELLGTLEDSLSDGRIDSAEDAEIADVATRFQSAIAEVVAWTSSRRDGRRPAKPATARKPRRQPSTKTTTKGAKAA